MDNHLRVANALDALNYGEMMKLAQQFTDMVSGRKHGDDFDPESKEDWASMFHAWAESTIEASKEPD